VPSGGEQPTGSDAFDPAQRQPGATVQVTRVDQVTGDEREQVCEDGGFPAGKELCLADALSLVVVEGELERDVASRKLEPVDARSTPVGHELHAAAFLT
jgi:hypothetical protein